jgi:hypothetical protein
VILLRRNREYNRENGKGKDLTDVTEGFLDDNDNSLPRYLPYFEDKFCDYYG